jgi:hypothetical protein
VDHAGEKMRAFQFSRRNGYGQIDGPTPALITKTKTPPEPNKKELKGGVSGILLVSPGIVSR